MTHVYLRFPGGLKKALTLSYDDAVEQDIRLAEILDKYGIKATFNINSGVYTEEGTVFPTGQIHRRMTEKQVTDTFIKSGHEIAVHSSTHPFLEQLPTALAVQEIVKDREKLEDQFGVIVRGMAYPYGTFNDDVVTLLKSCGIAYSRTVISTNDFRIPTDWLRLTATCHHNSPELNSLTEKFLKDTIYHAPYLFYLWGHSFEFEADNNWNLIEEFAEKIANNKEVWYATNIEIYEYIEAYRSLVFSVNGKRIKNPTSYVIWFEYNGKIMSIHPGEIICVA